ncbi:MAG: tetraacyldisaccharide 4'-kinase [Veillonella sp.]
MKQSTSLNVCTLDEWANGENGSPVDTYRRIESWRLVVSRTTQSFTQALTDIGYNVVHTMPFGDHHNFENDDVVDIWKEAFAHQADAICITEKDAVKLSQLHAIEDLKMPILVLSIGIEFISEKQEFIENLEI